MLNWNSKGTTFKSSLSVAFRLKELNLVCTATDVFMAGFSKACSLSNSSNFSSAGPLSVSATAFGKARAPAFAASFAALFAASFSARTLS